MKFTDVMEKKWGVVKESGRKMENGEPLTQEDIDGSIEFMTALSQMQHFFQDNFMKQRLNRRYRKEGDIYILDEKGDYISFLGMWGQVWYKKINTVTGESGKHITPFG